MYYEVSGRIKGKDGEYGARKVFMIRQNDLKILDSTISDFNTGEYLLKTATPDPVTIVVFPQSGETTNAAVFHNIYPQQVIVPPEGVNDIGIPGQPGFGIGIAPVIPDGFVPLDGFDDPYHENYGNYRVISDGSIMCWIPAFYFKWGDGSNGLGLNICHIKNYSIYASESAANADGYALHRAFIDGGQVKDGFFVDKYMNSKHPSLNVASSLYATTPLSVSSSFNPISQLGVVNEFRGCIDAAKLRGSGFFCQSIFISNAMAMLSKSHGDHSISTEYCGWYGSTNNFPKGNINSADPGNPTNNTDMRLRCWRSINLNGYANLTGSWNIVEATTHNGQKSGVTDVCGNMWEVTPGLTFLSSSFRYLKESFSMKNGTSGTTNATDFWNVAPYDSIGSTLSDFSNSFGWVYRSGSVKAFSTVVDRNDVNYKYNCIGIPQPGNILTSNPNYFGGGIVRGITETLCPCTGGSWAGLLDSGIFCLHLGNSYTTSTTPGFRSAFYL